METASILLTVLIVLFTVLPLSRNPHWLIRGMDFPRMQLAVVAAGTLVAQALLLDTGDTGVQLQMLALLLCLVWQVWWILPYTRLWPCEVGRADPERLESSLSILTSNVLTPNRNAQALVELVRQHAPDILVTLESDAWWERQLEVLEREMPYSVKCPLDNLYGMHVFSRLEIVEHELCFLVEEDVPSIHMTVALPGGDHVRAHLLHPAPPSPTENPESAERDAELLLVARRVENEQRPVVVTGDLNDVAWSPTTRLFRKISGLLDPRVGRGMFNTFHAGIVLARWPLDHIFHSKHFRLLDIRRLPSIGSDHFPLLVRLSYAATADESQQGIEPDPGDRERATEVIEEKNAGHVAVP